MQNFGALASPVPRSSKQLFRFAKIVLNRGPAERVALAGVFLEAASHRGAVGSIAERAFREAPLSEDQPFSGSA